MLLLGLGALPTPVSAATPHLASVPAVSSPSPAAALPTAPVAGRSAAAAPAVPVPNGRQQLITVHATVGSWSATLYAWESQNGSWVKAFGPWMVTTAGGIGPANEWNQYVPEGTFPLTQALGRAANPGTAMPYRQVDAYDYWDRGVFSPTYNQLIRRATPPPNGHGLFDRLTGLEMAIDIGANLNPTVPGGGSMSFISMRYGLTDNRDVTVDQPQMWRLLSWLDPARQPLIQLSSIGWTDQWVPPGNLVRDGEFAQVGEDQRVFLAVGGSLVHVDSWAPFGGPQPIVAASWETYYRMRRVPADGTFVSSPDTGRVYRFAGGAPVHVDSWAPFGGPQPTQLIPPSAISQAGTGQWADLRQAPADGTFVATAGEGKVYRYAGGAPVYIDSWAPFGGMQPFTWVTPRSISAAGTGLWSQTRRTPADGTYVLRPGSGQVFRMLGGAPVYVDTWGWGRPQPTTTLPDAAFDLAGQGPWANLQRTPKDGTFATADSRTYVFVGGALVNVDSWAPFGGPQPTTSVTSSTVWNAGQGPWSNLRRVPKDGTFVATGGEGKVYRFAGGAPLYVDSWAPFGGQQPYTVVTPSSMSNPESGSVWMSRTPADGTFVATVGDGRVYRYAGGAPMYVADWAPFGGVQPYTWVSSGVVGAAGQGPWAFQRRTPVDGTFVATDDGRVYVFAGGAPFYVASWTPFGGGQPLTRVSSGAVDQAGLGPWSNLRATAPDGTMLLEAGSWQQYRVIGGAPVWLDPKDQQYWSPTGTHVSPEVFSQAGKPGRWSKIRSAPVDGTRFYAQQIGFFEFQGGRLVRLPTEPANAASLPVLSGTIIAGAGTGRWWGIQPPA